MVVSEGGKVLVGQGGLFRYEKSAALPANYAKTIMSVNGGEFEIDGGETIFTNFNGYVDIRGTGSATGTVRLTSGKLVLADMDHIYGDYNGIGCVRVYPGGRYVQTGGTNDTTSFMNGNFPFALYGGEADISGDSLWQVSGGLWRNDAQSRHGTPYLTTGDGLFRFRDNSVLDLYPNDSSVILYVAPKSEGATSVLEFRDNAKIDSARYGSGGNQMNLIVGGTASVRGYAYLRLMSDVWHNSSFGTPSLNSPNNCAIAYKVAVGDHLGYNELEIGAGTFSVGIYGMHVGSRYIKTNGTGNSCVTGVVKVTGGALRTASCHFMVNNWWVPGKSDGPGQFGGDQIGTSAGAAAGHFYGRMEIDSGSYTNTRGQLTIGYGLGHGEWFQRGGVAVVGSDTSYAPTYTYKSLTSPKQYLTNNLFSVGIFGGKGAFTQTGGDVKINMRAYVGGVSTNDMTLFNDYAKTFEPLNLDGGAFLYDCIVNDYGSRHHAEGYLGVFGGTFSVLNGITVGKDGTGVLEIGPTGTLSAASIVLANNEYTAVGTSAATLKFTFDETGIGMAEVTNFVVASGSSLVVDMRDYDIANSARSRFRLLKAANVEGTFDKSNVTLLLPDENLASRVNLDCTAGGIEVKLLRGSVIMFR